MDNVKVKISEGGRIVIPAEYRRSLGLGIGDEVIIRLEDRTLRVLSVREGIRQAQEILRPYLPQDRSLADELIAERRAEAARE